MSNLEECLALVNHALSPALEGVKNFLKIVEAGLVNFKSVEIIFDRKRDKQFGSLTLSLYCKHGGEYHIDSMCGVLKSPGRIACYWSD